MARIFQHMVDQTNTQILPTLRINKPAAAYARRSPAYARDEKKDKTQSREMQTSDIRQWAGEQGWRDEYFYPYFSDFGLSGTLRPDQRPDMLRLFDDIDAGQFDDGSVICYQESRLFRDETQIYYNQFIDKCKAHNVAVISISPYLMIYDFRDDFLTEMFRWKCKEAADFIRRHVKGWMLRARHRAAWNDGEWAGLGNLPAGFIVDYDEKSPTYKKLIPYWPHADVKMEYRLLFVDLGCNISLLYKRLRESPIVFPEFEDWVDPRSISRFLMSPYPGGGYYPRDKATIRNMLTDVLDIGLRSIDGVMRRDQSGAIKEDHTPICERTLFDLCYYPLARTDFEGNPLESARAARYFHRGNEGEFGLLKFRLTSTQGDALTHAGGEYEGEQPLEVGSYVIQSLEKEIALRHCITHAVVPCEEVDDLVVSRLMQHVHDISQCREDIEEHEKQAKKHRAERGRKLAQMTKSVSDIEREQGGLTRSVGKIEAEIEEAEQAGDESKKALKERRKHLVEEQIEMLEAERLRVLKAITDLKQETEAELGTLDEELLRLEARWPQYSFGKRRSLINFLIQEVVLDAMTAHWMRVEVRWLLEDWGTEECYYRRHIGARQWWKDEEDALIRRYYPAMPKDQLMALLPERGWQAIMQRAQALSILRERGIPKVEDEMIRRARHESLADLQFMRTHAIPSSSTRTEWKRSFSRPPPAS